MKSRALRIRGSASRRFRRLARRIRLASVARFSYRAAGDERGQAMLEYVVVTLTCVALLIGLSRSMQIAIARYLAPIYFWVGLPIP